MDAIAQNLGYGHAGDAQLIQSSLESFETILRSDDTNLAQLVLTGRSSYARSGYSSWSYISGSYGRHFLHSRHEVSIAGKQTMFFHIQALDFFSFANAQANQFIEYTKDNGHSNCYINGHGYNAYDLSHQKAGASAVEQAILSSEEAGYDGTKGTAHTVYRNSTNRVINLQLLVEEFNSHNNQNTSQQAND